MAQCDDPFTLKETGLQFPCGKCFLCKKRRASGWAFRLRKELQYSESAFFITLTYNTDFIPISNQGHYTLNKSHCQLFIKRLRKHQPTNDIKYYLAGEYGDERQRPHYHIIMFNINLSTLVGETMAKVSLRDPATYLKGKYHFECKHWADPESKETYGVISIGTVTMASIQYALKYLLKPITNKENRKREFSLMSKGLGKQYVSPDVKQWHLDNLIERMYLPDTYGAKIAMPKYYKKLIYTDVERELIAIHIADWEQKQFDKLTTQEKNDKLQRKINSISENNRKLARKPLR